MSDSILPLSLCIEDLEAQPDDDRYIQCVALVGRRPGLVITTHGRIGWKVQGPVACELWRSGDGMLALYRPETGPELVIEVHRAGRALRVPYGKPVILRHHDLLAINGKTWKVHIHGPTRHVAAPSVLRRSLFVAVASMAMAVAGSGCSDDGTIDVRENPPGPTQTPDDGGDADGNPADSSPEDADDSAASD